MIFAQVPAAPPPEVRPQTQRPLTIKLTLTDPSQLQVREGQRVSLGSILAERTDTRLTLEARLTELKNQLNLDRPTPDFFAVAKLRELEYQQLHQEYETQRQLVTQLIALPDPPPAIHRQEINRLQSLYSRLQLAHERLAQAHWGATQQQHNHALTLQQQRETLTQQIQLLEQEIALTTIRSPVAGTLSRVRFTEQTDHSLHVEIQITPN